MFHQVGGGVTGLHVGGKGLAGGRVGLSTGGLGLAHTILKVAEKVLNSTGHGYLLGGVGLEAFGGAGLVRSK